MSRGGPGRDIRSGNGRGFPSIDALRAFLEAARASSFTRAAEVLHLSPSALSQQIQGARD
jgi:LysR family glycine cleavage system transcriptional activator